MKHLKISALILILGLMISCIPTPKRVGIRGPIKQKDLAFLESESISRKDVLLHLGQPEEVLQNGKVYDYKWIGAWNYNSLIIQPGSIEVQHCNVLRFFFDGRGNVRDVYIRSYKPQVLLASNRECRYDQPMGSLMGILKPKMSTDYAFIKVRQTRGQEVLQRLGWADVGLGVPGFLWFRWDDASPYVKAQSSRVVPPKAVNSGNRKKKMCNLLVELDNSDVVVRVENVKDGDLMPKFFTWASRSEQAPAKLSSLAKSRYPVTTDGRQGHNWLMSVDVDALKFWDGIRLRWFIVPYKKIRSVKMNGKAGVNPNFTLRFQDEYVWGKKLNISVKPDELLTMLKYMIQSNPRLGTLQNAN
jgi:hypothetical protein